MESPLIDINEYMKRPLHDRQIHLDLLEVCLERGGMSTYFKGLMAHYLNTTIPSGMKIQICHACGNAKCSNPKLLYFGTPKENYSDSVKHGTSKNPWQRAVEKYGIEVALDRARNHQKRVSGKNTFYITNGIIIKRWPIGKEIPENFRKGRK